MTQPRRRLRIFGKILLFGALILAAGLVVAHFAWKYSGSNQWEFVREANGVKVYALKAPGTTLKQFKGITRIKTRLNPIVATMTDTSTEACRTFVPGCVSGKIFQPWDPQTHSFIQGYRVMLPKPMVPRDLVIKTTFSQDPKTNSLFVQCDALPELLPRDPCCFQVTHMHNSWRYTPVGNGELELEFRSNYDIGFPYVLVNHAGPTGIPQFLPPLVNVFNRVKYQHTQFDFVHEQ
jgi:hypothetical protein